MKSDKDVTKIKRVTFFSETQCRDYSCQFRLICGPSRLSAQHSCYSSNGPGKLSQ